MAHFVAVTHHNVRKGVQECGLIECTGADPCLTLTHLGSVDVEGPGGVGKVTIAILTNNQSGMVLDAAASGSGHQHMSLHSRK